MTPDRIAINSVSTRQTPLEESLDAYAAAGFKNVEFQLRLVKDWLKAGRKAIFAIIACKKHSPTRNYLQNPCFL